MDKYDVAVDYLTQHPEEISEAWGWPDTHPAGCLFSYCGDWEDDDVGCLTMVRAGLSAATEELTLAIRADARLPDDETKITVEHLPVFAEWQRRLDKELRGR